MKETAILQAMFDAAADSATKKWFENYLKHAVICRGLKTPRVIECIKTWRTEHRIFEWPPEKQLDLAAYLIRGTYAEDKFAGIVLIQLHLLKALPFKILADCIENLFEEGCFYDWSTTDWMNVRVLSPLIDLHGFLAIGRFSSWVSSANLWQRRSSIVSLRACVRSPDYLHVIDSVIESLSSSDERFIQTGIGWVISDLSKQYPKEAEALVERYFDRLSSEVIRRHTRFLPHHKEYIRRKKSE